jgi:hypothetical protein
MNKAKILFKTSPILSSLAFITLALIIVVSFHLREFKHFEAIVQHPVIIENIKIDKQGDYTWKVPNGTWNSRKGEGRISLVLNRVSQFKGEELLDRAKRPLKLKIEVYALQKDGTRIDRLIRNWYFTSDEPFSEAGSKLWSSGGNDQFEYGLAGIWAYPREEVFIRLQIMKPDTILAHGNPHLKISSDYDYAAVPWVALFVLICYGILIILICFLLIISYVIWRKYRKAKTAT